MKKKGISLIILVITIVVIIILAAAVILSMGDNNPVESAKEAQKAQEFANMQTELEVYISTQYANTLGAFDRNTFNVDKTTEPSIVEVLTSIKGTKYEDIISIFNGKIVQKINQGEKVYGVNATITGNDFAYNNPVIPVGFRTLETTKASWKDSDNNGTPDGWNEGLVILDENDNEYVWIPVYENVNGKSVSYSKINSNVVKNCVLLDSEVKDDTLPKSVNDEYEQINKYGGFYVARYEASLPDSQTTEQLMKTKVFSWKENDKIDLGLPQSKFNKIPWYNISYKNAKILSESVISNEYVQSGMITGTQWDTMCKFISQEEYNGETLILSPNSWAWGNYYNRAGYDIDNVYYKDFSMYSQPYKIKGSYQKQEKGFLQLPTGIFNYSVTDLNTKNLCDVAGNYYEFCAEIVIQNSANAPEGNVVLRGGSYAQYSGDAWAIIRNGTYIGSANAFHGFRFVLYVK